MESDRARAVVMWVSKWNISAKNSSSVRGKRPPMAAEEGE